MKTQETSLVPVTIDERNFRFEVVRNFADELAGYTGVIQGRTGRRQETVAFFVEHPTAYHAVLVSLTWREGSNEVIIKCDDTMALAKVSADFSIWIEDLEEDDTNKRPYVTSSTYRDDDGLYVVTSLFRKEDDDEEA